MVKIKKSPNTFFGFDYVVLLGFVMAIIIGFFLGAQYMKSSNTQVVSDSTDDSNLLTYKNEKFNFQFQYPQEYSVEVSESAGGITSLAVLKKDSEVSSNGVMVYVGSPLIERSDYYYGGRMWTSYIINILNDVKEGEKVDGAKENITKISNITTGDFKGVKYDSEPIEGESNLNAALSNGDLTLLISIANDPNQINDDTEVFEGMIQTISSVK